MHIDNITSEKMTLDADGKSMQISIYRKNIEQLQQENKILKENAENNDKVVDKVNWENQLLKKENKKQKEVIDKIRKEINEEHSIMGVEVVENWVLKDILKEVE